MKTELLLKKLEGIQTVDSASRILRTNKDKAIYYLYRLRKAGYVKTKRLSDNRRVYHISFENRLKGTSYFEIINRYSPVKIATPILYKIYGKDPGLEETLVYAIRTGSLRTILASLALFRKIADWGGLYRLAKKNRIERHVGALYDLARRIMRVRRMPDRFRNNALPQQASYVEYTMPRFMSEDFKDIGETWKIHLPFDKGDLGDYR